MAWRLKKRWIHTFKIWKNLFLRNFCNINLPMSDSKIARFLWFFSILERQSFRVSKCMVIITWPFVILTNFCFFMEFCEFYVLHYTRKMRQKNHARRNDHYSPKMYEPSRFDNSLLWKTVLLPQLVIWFSKFLCLFPDWYIDEPFSVCNERLGYPEVK